MSTSRIPTLTPERSYKKRIGLWLVLTPTIVLIGTNILYRLYITLAIPESTPDPRLVNGYTEITAIVTIISFWAGLAWLPSLIIGIILLVRKPKKAVQATPPSPPPSLLK